MGTFLLIILVLFIFFAIIKPLLRGYMVVRRYRKAFRDAFDGAGYPGGTGSRTGQRRGAAGAEKPEPRKKVFTSDMGEYVAFEEVAVSEQSTAASSSASSGSTVVVEQQIVDAEWEDVETK